MLASSMVYVCIKAQTSAFKYVLLPICFVGLTIMLLSVFQIVSVIVGNGPTDILVKLSFNLRVITLPIGLMSFSMWYYLTKEPVIETR